MYSLATQERQFSFFTFNFNIHFMLFHSHSFWYVSLRNFLYLLCSLFSIYFPHLSFIFLVWLLLKFCAALCYSLFCWRCSKVARSHCLSGHLFFLICSVHKQKINKLTIIRKDRNFFIWCFSLDFPSIY